VSSKAAFTQTVINETRKMNVCQAPCKVTWIYADNELDTTTFELYTTTTGITPRFTTPDCSEQNGYGERPIRTIVEGGQSMRHRAGLPPSTLLLACAYFTYIRNHIPKQNFHKSTTDPTRSLSPIELYNRYDGGTWRTHLSGILDFGCECYVHTPYRKRSQGKTSYRGERGVLLGRAPNRKCWLILSLDRHTYIYARQLVPLTG